MDVEKAASKGHGFFSLFDWSKKSRKRLFSGSGTGSPRNIGDGKEVDGGTPSTPSNSVVEDVPSLKGSSEHSCSSSVIDEEAHARRGPTVVAKLMGLESMPAASSSGSYSKPLTVEQSFQNNVHDELIGRSFGSPHKMPGSPIDRFKMEALPPRFAKRTLSVAQYKLLSPIKNPNHISSRNAVDIMEAASRIIGPGVGNISSYRVLDAGHANAACAYSPREIIRVQRRSPKLNEALKKCDGSSSSRPPVGKPLNGRSRSTESTSSSRVLQSNVGDPVGPKVKRSNRSSPVARATNVQGREGINKNSRKLAIHRDIERSMDERSGFNHQKSNDQRGTGSSSNVLAQNDRKQNTMVVKRKVNSKPATHSQHRSNSRSINASPRRVDAAITVTENSTDGNRMVELQPTSHSNRRSHSTAKTIPKPRRSSEKSQSSDKIISDRSRRRIRHNIVIDEPSSFSMNKKKISTEIVSFTFTSPVDKSLPGAHFPNQLVETRFMENMNSMSTSSNTSNSKHDAIDGDYLGLLLEQKLRELTSGVRSPYSKPAKGVRIYAPAPVLEDMASARETSSIASTDYERELLQSFKDGKANFRRTDLVSKSGQSSQSVECYNDVMDQTELEHLHLSPLSTWEASLSTETCSSSESWRSANGTRFFSSTEATRTSDSAHLRKVLEVVDALSEYSDTASSITVTTAEIPPSEISSSCRMDSSQEVEFLREILNATSLIDRICSSLRGHSDILDPHIMEELNGNIRLVLGGEEGKALRMRQRLLFDCVNEFLSVKCAYYFTAGYGSWFMGMAVLQKLSAEELYREMTSLKVAEEWMVDELVYREMSSPLGSWVDFKTESYEAGGDVATELLGSFIDEMVDDLLTDAL